MSHRMSRPVSSKCLKCPSFLAGKCSGNFTTTTAQRRLATDVSPPTRKNKKEGDISSVFTSFSGRKAEPLPERYRDLKKNLTTGFEEQIQKSWDALVEVLKVRTEEVATKRESVSWFRRFHFFHPFFSKNSKSVMLSQVDHSTSQVFGHSNPHRTFIKHRCYQTNWCCRHQGRCAERCHRSPSFRRPQVLCRTSLQRVPTKRRRKGSAGCDPFRSTEFDVN